MSLVLRRSPGQSFVIGDNAEIKITFHRIENDQAVFGVDAPKSIKVNRLEKHKSKQALEAADEILVNLE